jgi:hypothetical protein
VGGRSICFPESPGLWIRPHSFQIAFLPNHSHVRSYQASVIKKADRNRIENSFPIRIINKHIVHLSNDQPNFIVESRKKLVLGGFRLLGMMESFLHNSWYYIQRHHGEVPKQNRLKNGDLRPDGLGMDDLMLIIFVLLHDTV